MILNEFFNLPQVFEKDMNEFDASGYDRYNIYMDDYDLKEKFSDLDDAVEAIEAYKRDDPKSRYADYNVRDLNGKIVWRNDAWQDVPKPGKIQFLPRNDQGVAEGMFGSRPNPVLPIVAKIDRVARELNPQNVETGKQIIQSHTKDITRMLSPQAKAGVDVIEQGMAEATGDEKFDTMMSQMQREPKYPDSQMPPTDVKDLYQWAVKNNKPYHKIFANWANREGYKSVAPALQRAGNLDTEALDYWTPDVWKIYWAEVRGIDWEMPPEWAKKRVPDELRDYLDTVFDAYDRIVFDWPTEYRQIGGQDNYAEGASIVSRKSPLGPTRLTSIRKAYLATKLYIDDELFEQHQPFEDLDTNTQGQVYDLLIQARDGFFHGNAKMALEALRSVNDLCDDLDDNVYPFIKHKTGVDIFNLDSTKDQGMAEAKDDYVPPKEANYDDKYQAMVRRVGQKAKQQEKAKQQPKAPVRESRKALLKQIIQS
jgi:hypothetical protein